MEERGGGGLGVCRMVELPGRETRGTFRVMGILGIKLSALTAYTLLAPKVERTQN